MRIDRLAALAVTAAALLSGCGEERAILDVAGEAQACGRCHGYPPVAGTLGSTQVHPQSTDCSVCHAETVAANDVTFVDGDKHINGTVDAFRHPDFYIAPAQHAADFYAWKSGGESAPVCSTCHGEDYAGGISNMSCTACHQSVSQVASWRTNCTFCHGQRDTAWTVEGLNKAAPPPAVSGTPNDPAIGAHAAHLSSSPFGITVSCETCHTVPQATEEASLDHVDGDREVAFSGLAIARGASVSWNATTKTCATYCHGSTAKGGNATSLKWTDQPTLGCLSCHSFPPPSHTGTTVVGLRHGGAACTKCHEGYSTDVVVGRHLNGTADVYFPKQGSPGETFTHTTGWNDCEGCHRNNAQASDGFNGVLP